MSEGPRKESIADEDQFCDQQIIKSIMKSKEVFDQLEGHEMRKARTKSNPFEIIQGVFFLNRAAMKMAEMDAMFDYIFTSPKDKGGLFFLSHKRKLDFMLNFVFLVLSQLMSRQILGRLITQTKYFCLDRLYNNTRNANFNMKSCIFW